MKSGSNLEKVLTAGHFAFTGELGPPRGAHAEEGRKKAAFLKGRVDSVNITDNQTAMVRMASWPASLILIQEGLEPNYQMVCRDRNRLAMQADILGACGAMTMQEVSEMLDYLLAMEKSGCKVVSCNGLSFDFAVLAEESGRMIECAQLALRHVDMMFHVLCAKGHPLGLDKTAKGIGLTGKTEGMHGDLAPDMWAKSLDDRLKVLEYVAQDARTTLAVAGVGDKNKGIQWVSGSGRLNPLAFEPWCTVSEALGFKLPDTSWMTNPIPREQFYQWTDSIIGGTS